MDLRSHYPFSLLNNGIIRTYPSLKSNLRTEVAVIGAGITGALIAWKLAKSGLTVTVIDKRHVGMGSTAASTGLLQYEIDTPLVTLEKKAGIVTALSSYHLCSYAIDRLEEICRSLKMPTGFKRKPSFQFASSKGDVKQLREEFMARKESGFDIQWMDKRDIQQYYGFSKPAGVLSEQGAQVDAYALTHALLQDVSPGISIYDHTGISRIEHRKRGCRLITEDGNTVDCRKLVFACGYESQNYIPFQVQQLQSTYAIVSEPMTKSPWYRESLIWETSLPYLYLRSTSDNRVLVGGLDEKIKSPGKRDRLLPSKKSQLKKRIKSLFPHLPFKTDYEWAGSFAGTKDGLPYIGSIRQRPHSYFALGYGGNGITFSLLAAEIITDLAHGKKNDGAELFSFDR